MHYNSHRFRGAMDSFPGCKRPCKIPLIHAFVEQRPTATPQHVVLPQGGPCKIPFTHAQAYRTMWAQISGAERPTWTLHAMRHGWQSLHGLTAYAGKHKNMKS